MAVLRFLSGGVLGLLLLFPCGPIYAGTVHVGYVTGVEPAKSGIVDGTFDRATGERIEWRRFDNGAEVVRALAAGDLDIANLGSSVVAVAASRQLPIETFLIASQLGQSEALVARNGSGIRFSHFRNSRSICSGPRESQICCNCSGSAHERNPLSSAS